MRFDKFDKIINKAARWIERFKKGKIIIVIGFSFVIILGFMTIYGFYSGFSYNSLLGNIKLTAEEALKKLINIEKSVDDSGEKIDKVSEQLDEITGIDCCKLDELWEIIGNAVIEDKYFILNDNEIRGTIRLRRPLYNLLILEISFVPFSQKNMDTIFALKDKNNNELILTTSDGSKSVKLTYKEGDDTILGSEKSVIGGIKKGEEIKLRVETVLRYKSIFTSAMFSYVPIRKPMERITENIDIEAPYEYKSGGFNFHIGLEGSEMPEENIKLNIVSCSIHEKPREEFSW